METPKKAKEPKEEEAKKLSKAIKAAQVEGNLVPELAERKLYHVEVDTVAKYDTKTGKKLTNAFVQKYSIPEFKTFEKDAASLGYEIKVLWNPELYKA